MLNEEDFQKLVEEWTFKLKAELARTQIRFADYIVECPTSYGTYIYGAYRKLPGYGSPEITMDGDSDNSLGSQQVSATFSVKKTRSAAKNISFALSEPTDYWITPRTAARCDPSTILHDGLTAVQCLERYEAFQRDEINGLPPLTDSQKEVARKLRVK